MKRVNRKYILKIIDLNIKLYYDMLSEEIKQIKLTDILVMKNPYLISLKGIGTSGTLIEYLIDDYLFLKEKLFLDKLLVELAIFTCNKVYGGKKSSAEGIDLEFEKDGVIYVVAVKSGTNWGNASQISKMRDNFRKAKQRLRTNAKKRPVEAINGCCYGRVVKSDKCDYQKIAGQQFWKFVSGDSELFIKIVEPLQQRSSVRNEKFVNEYARLMNIFSLQFSNEFCIDGEIDWKKIVQLNSGIEKIKVNI
jgi:hypothetical protein